MRWVASQNDSVVVRVSVGSMGVLYGCWAPIVKGSKLGNHSSLAGLYVHETTCIGIMETPAALAQSHAP